MKRRQEPWTDDSYHLLSVYSWDEHPPQTYHPRAASTFTARGGVASTSISALRAQALSPSSTNPSSAAHSSLPHLPTISRQLSAAPPVSRSAWHRSASSSSLSAQQYASEYRDADAGQPEGQPPPFPAGGNAPRPVAGSASSGAVKSGKALCGRAWSLSWCRCCMLLLLIYSIATPLAMIRWLRAGSPAASAASHVGVFYHLHSVEKAHLDNLRFFLYHAPCESKLGHKLDFHVVLPGDVLASQLPALPEEWTLLQERSSCDRYSTVADAIAARAAAKQPFDGVILLDSTARGPFLPSYVARRLAWPDTFLARLNDATPVVSAAIRCVASNGTSAGVYVNDPYAFALNARGISALRNAVSDIPCLLRRRDPSAVIAHIDAQALQSQRTFASLQHKYLQWDWSVKANRACKLSKLSDWQANNLDADAMETVFVRHVDKYRALAWDSARYTETLSVWMNRRLRKILHVRKNRGAYRLAAVSSALQCFHRQLEPSRCFDTAFYAKRHAANLPATLSGCRDERRCWNYFVARGVREGHSARFSCDVHAPDNLTSFVLGFEPPGDYNYSVPARDVLRAVTPSDRPAGALAGSSVELSAAKTAPPPVPPPPPDLPLCLASGDVPYVRLMPSDVSGDWMSQLDAVNASFAAAQTRVDAAWRLESNATCGGARVHGAVNKTAAGSALVALENDWSAVEAFASIGIPIYAGVKIFVSKKYKFIYIGHARSASSTILTALRLLFCARSACTRSELAQDHDIDDIIWANYFVFTFVRNPFARLLSTFFAFRTQFPLRQRANDTLDALGGVCHPPFAAVAADAYNLRRACDSHGCCAYVEAQRMWEFDFVNPYLTQQAHAVFAPDGAAAVDYIGRVEHIEEDWLEVVAQISARARGAPPPCRLQQRNDMGAVEGDECLAPDIQRMNLLNETTLRSIARQFAMDVALFGFLPEPDTAAVAASSVTDEPPTASTATAAANATVAEAPAGTANETTDVDALDLAALFAAPPPAANVSAAVPARAHAPRELIVANLTGNARLANATAVALAPPLSFNLSSPRAAANSTSDAVLGTIDLAALPPSRTPLASVAQAPPRTDRVSPPNSLSLAPAMPASAAPSTDPLPEIEAVLRDFRAAKAQVDALWAAGGSESRVCRGAGVHGEMQKRAALSDLLAMDGELESTKLYASLGVPIYSAKHVYVSTKYKFIYVMQSRSASGSLMEALEKAVCESELCQPDELRLTTHIDDATWAAYFVFTFVRNPIARALSTFVTFRDRSPLLTVVAEGQPPGAPCLLDFHEFARDAFKLRSMCDAHRCCVFHEAPVSRWDPDFVNPHITQQAHSVFARNGACAVDFIGRVEFISEDWRQVTTIIAIRSGLAVRRVDLVNLHRSDEDAEFVPDERHGCLASGSPEVALLTETAMRSIASQYAYDMRAFGFMPGFETRG